MNDFKRKGYTKKSLDMLKSKEGQLNAVFACYGSAVQHAQYLEKSFAELLELINELSGETITIKKKSTIGNSLFALEKLEEKGIFSTNDEWVYELLEYVKETRNWLAHKYFLDREDKFKNKKGRMSMLSELVWLEKGFGAAEGLSNGAKIAIQEHIDGKRTVTTDKNVVFTIEVKTPDD